MEKSKMGYFEKNIEKIYGDPGRKWLKSLPDLIQRDCSLNCVTHLQLNL